MQRDERDDTTPLACNLGVFDGDERAYHESNAEAVLTAAEAIEETAHGYAFRLPGDAATLQRAGAFIAHESRCCPFFRFDLTVLPREDVAWLELGGSDEVKAYMASELLTQVQRWRPGLEPRQGPQAPDQAGKHERTGSET